MYGKALAFAHVTFAVEDSVSLLDNFFAHLKIVHSSNTSPMERSGFRSQYQVPSSRKILREPRISKCLFISQRLRKHTLSFLQSQPFAPRPEGWGLPYKDNYCS